MDEIPDKHNARDKEIVSSPQVFESKIHDLLNGSVIRCIGNRILIIGSTADGPKINLIFDGLSFSGFFREYGDSGNIELRQPLVKKFFRYYLSNVFDPKSNPKITMTDNFSYLKTALEEESS